MNTSTEELEASCCSSSATDNQKLHKVELLINPAEITGCQKDGQAWFVATSLQSDLRVEVDSTEFHLHKFPLLSRSGLLNRLVFESRDTEKDHIRLLRFPGGRHAFELAAKFCYGVSVTITTANVAALRCASQYLEMDADHLPPGGRPPNLVAETESFLSSRVFPSWNDSISVLRTCSSPDLAPWSEKLEISQRCIESIAWKASTDPKGIRWSFTRGRNPAPAPAPAPAPGPGAGSRSHTNQRIDLRSHELELEKSVATTTTTTTATTTIPQDWWFEDVCLLSTDHFVRTMNAIKAKGVRADLIGSAVSCYATKWLPSLLLLEDDAVNHHPYVEQDGFKGFELIVNKSAPKEQIVDEDGENRGEDDDKDGGCDHHAFRGFDLPSSADVEDLCEVRSKHCAFVESMISVLPAQIDAVSVSFQFRLLRVAHLLGINSECREELEKRVAMQFDQVSPRDLLPPSNQMYEIANDVDMVYRIVQSFLLHHENSLPDGSPLLKSPSVISASVKAKIAEVLDGYLAHVANDPKLPLQNFQDITEVLPGNARLSHDGLYKAIDIFLKVHPDLTEEERKQLCRSIDVHKLSLDSCMHVSQNDRLPLRMVIRVLFSEHMKLRNALTGGGHSPLTPSEDNTPPLHVLTQFARASTSDSDPQSSRDGWSIHNHHHHHHSADVRALQVEVQQMKTEFMGLRSYCSGLEEQLDSKAPKKKGFFSWPGSSFSKKLNSKLKSISSRRQSSSEPPHLSTLSGAANNTSFNANKSSSNNDRWRRRNSVS